MMPHTLELEKQNKSFGNVFHPWNWAKQEKKKYINLLE